jgi:hypothetical protein
MKDSSGNTVTVERIPRFRLTRGGQVEIIDFIPAANIPGYSHRIAVNNNLTQTYLGASFKPSVSVAIQMSDIIREKNGILPMAHFASQRSAAVHGS